MIFETKDREPQIDVPKIKAIIIDGQQVGEATPHLNNDTLRWHACIRVPNKARIVGTTLMQGHGQSVREAIADAIICARREKAAFAEALAAIEEGLGVDEVDSDELRRVR